MIFDVNNSEVKRFSDRLRQMHRSDMPIVVRQTLNDLAFDVKQRTLLQSADKTFILRNPSFFKRHSGVKKAVGWGINSMYSEVGINPMGSKAATQLTKQEYGGSIGKRPAIYMNTARVSKSKLKRVRRVNYLSAKGRLKGRPNRLRSDKSQFVADVIVAKRENLLMLKDNTLFDVEYVHFSTKGTRNRKVGVTLTPVASYEKDRTVNLKARPFLKPASLLSYQKASTIFVKNATKRINK